MARRTVTYPSGRKKTFTARGAPTETRGITGGPGLKRRAGSALPRRPVRGGKRTPGTRYNLGGTGRKKVGQTKGAREATVKKLKGGGSGKPPTVGGGGVQKAVGRAAAAKTLAARKKPRKGAATSASIKGISFKVKK